MLTTLPELPPNLKILHCQCNRLTHLPENLPDSLEFLCCAYNNIEHLPQRMPANLKALYCKKNRLTELPSPMPKLLHLDCSFNQLTYLPTIPDTLYFFQCSCNNLTDMAPLVLNPNLMGIRLLFNNLTSTPIFTGENCTFMFDFDISYNNIVNIDSLQDIQTIPIDKLNLSYNNITAIPEFISNIELKQIFINHNQILDLPDNFDSYKQDIKDQIIKEMATQNMDTEEIKLNHRQQFKNSESDVKTIDPVANQLMLPENFSKQIQKAIHSLTKRTDYNRWNLHANQKGVNAFIRVERELLNRIFNDYLTIIHYKHDKEPVYDIFEWSVCNNFPNIFPKLYEQKLEEDQQNPNNEILEEPMR